MTNREQEAKRIMRELLTMGYAKKSVYELACMIADYVIAEREKAYKKGYDVCYEAHRKLITNQQKGEG